MTPGPVPSRDFALVLTSEGEDAVLRVQGEIDCHTAPDVVAFLDNAIEQGHRRVVLHLGDVDFLGAAGLGIIAAGAGRLHATGRDLLIRAPSPSAYRLLELMGLVAVVNVERPGAVAGPVAPGRATVDSGTGDAHDGSPPTAAAAFGQGVLDSALGLVVALAQAVVPGVDGASVTMRRDARFVSAATTDDFVGELDAVQYDSGEGPCVTAASESRSAQVESLSDEVRWPAFTARARSEGMASVLSTPLVTPVSAAGALNLYSRTPGAFADPERELAAILAAEVSALVTGAVPPPAGEQRRRAYQDAVSAGQVIAQAQGVLIERVGMTRRQAYADLRRRCHEAGIPLGDWAEQFVAAAEEGRRVPPTPRDAS